MNKKNENYDIAFKNALKILEETVDFYYIFPDYFLKQLKEKNLELYNNFENENFDNFLQSDEFVEKLKDEMEKYIENISEIKEKSYIISILKDFLDPNIFFSYLMNRESNEIRKKIENINFDAMKKTYEQVKLKKISRKDSLEILGFKEMDFKEYIDREIYDYMK